MSDSGSLASWSSSSSVETSSCSERKVVLVTGGAGFIGSHTAEALLARGDKVVVVDEMNDYYDVSIKRANVALLRRAAEAALAMTATTTVTDTGVATGATTGADATDAMDATDATTATTATTATGTAAATNASAATGIMLDNFVFVEGNICDRALMASVFEQHGITHVCHLAARAGVRPSLEDPFIYVETNVQGTVTLLELSAKHSVENFVYASSSSVYGGSKKEYFSEKDVVDNPVSPYAATKKTCELLASTYHHLYALNCTGLRFFTVYGPRGRPDMAPSLFMTKIMEGSPIKRFGDGTSERDYTNIRDIVQGTVMAIDTPLGCEVVNLGKGNTICLNDFIAAMESLCGRRAIINVLPDQPGDVPRTCADVSKAARLLGYKPTTQVEEGLAEMMEWFKGYSKSSAAKAATA